MCAVGNDFLPDQFFQSGAHRMAFAARYPGSADAMGLAGDAALAAGAPRAALARYVAAGEVRRPWPLVKRSAIALQALGDSAGAERLLAEHLAGDPGNAEAAALLARSAYSRGDFARAGVLLDHAFATGAGRDPILRSLRAEIALRLGDQPVALAQAARAYRLQPLSPVAAGMLSTALAGREGETLARAEPMAAKARALAAGRTLARR